MIAFETANMGGYLSDVYDNLENRSALKAPTTSVLFSECSLRHWAFDRSKAETKLDNLSTVFNGLKARSSMPPPSTSTSVCQAPGCLWTFEHGSSEAVQRSAQGIEFKRLAVVPVRVYAALMTSATGVQVIETYECAVSDKEKFAFYKTVPVTVTAAYVMDDQLKTATVYTKYNYGDSSITKGTVTAVPYVPGIVTRVPIAGSLNLHALTTRLLVTRSFARPDGSTFTSEETSPDLPISVEHLGYVHQDSIHSSLNLRRFTVIHEDVQVSGELPPVSMPHTVVRGDDGEPELVELAGSVHARFHRTDTCTRPDGSIYTAERVNAESWPIHELTEQRHHGCYERLLYQHRVNFMHTSMAFGVFNQMAIFMRRFATKPDGSEHVLRDWMQVGHHEVKIKERTVLH